MPNIVERIPQNMPNIVERIPRARKTQKSTERAWV